MTISYPRAIPSEMVIQQCSLRTQSNVAVSKSIFTGEEQVQAHQGQWWEANIILAASERADAAAISAWLASMNGREKTILFGDPMSTAPQGAASSTPGTPVVNGAGQTGGSLICDGAPNTITNYLKAGDYVGLGSGSTSRLHMVLADVSSDGSGNFTLDIWPNLRSSPDNDATLVVTSATGLFRLGKNISQWEEQRNLYGFSFNLTEVL